MNYQFNDIEKKWQDYWAKHHTFKASNTSDKPKYYVLDMFPYPSGAGLHVGHPLGYIASDIYARYKRHKGFNVLHPQGYDSFGLPAEQYAIQTGQHPAITTETNIKTYRRQLDQIGFSFDWSREVHTSSPEYYKWTQWIFIQLFESWYNNETNRAEPIDTLISIFSSEGNANVNAACDDDITIFSSEEWTQFSSEKQQDILLKYRLTYLAETEVNWCPALGTVLANDEIVNGVSERGGHPVVRKKMTQWSMRISAYAERLLQGLETIDWTESLKESQRNWIGKSVGAEVFFPILSFPNGEAKVGTSDRAGYMTGGSNSYLILDRAKQMRKAPTEAEKILWEELRNKKLDHKIRQQHLIDDFIVDFVCLAKGLVIEVDGNYHNTKEQQELDAQRTERLNREGFDVIRFTNDEVKQNISLVLQKIKSELNSRKSYKENLKKSSHINPKKSNHTMSPSPKERAGVRIFTTRPDTIFGVSFMTLAPEHDLVSLITTGNQKAEVEAYIDATAKRSERDRMADVKTISGVFTGAYAEHPFTKEPIPIWIGDYVLAGYGTGAVMSVPCGDQRDYDFAKHFNIPIPEIFQDVDISEEAYGSKDNVKITNSDFLNGLNYKKASKTAIYELEKLGQGEGKTNYRLRDAVFSRQRYWGEPFPVYYVNGKPQMIDKKHLPIVLPEVEKYLPTEEGEPPLGRADVWAWCTQSHAVVSNDLINNTTVHPLELNTMPGWAGSSWYFFRYMEEKANRDEMFATEDALNYWENVDLYIGGSEHATGHLLYSRFWVKFMKDRGFVGVEEPFKKLINQGMILGTSAIFFEFMPRFESDSKFDYNIILISDDIVKNFRDNHKDLRAELFDKILKLQFSSKDLEQVKEFVNKKKIQFGFMSRHVDVSLVNSSDELDLFRFKKWRPEFENAEFLTEVDGTFKVSREVEKMSKSKYNVVNPDAICEQYGADSLRLYEMFLGPLEQAKPWNTAGITGVHGFLKKLWKLYHQGDNESFYVSSESSTVLEELGEELKTLHKTIKKVEDDIENFSFNTSVSTFMIAINELTAQKCTSKAILEPLLILLSPYAPHIAEELWQKLGHNESISTAPFPKFEEKYLIESSKNYPISFNGKTRFTLELPLDLSKDE
ncbi:leucine--tRNA ligase, partial [Psychroserpens sp.]|uniref:leucine--tRNA ligase n=1 Tax=Psychroserpens sp. TaxID=2020870 RepID=UPI003C76F6BE